MAKILARTFGIILILIGIVGAFSNAFIGIGGYFMANAGVDIVNILLGIVLLAVSGNEASAGLWLRIMGVVYAALAVIGFLVMTAAGSASVLGFMSYNMADNWLYLALGVLMLVSGFMEDSSVRAVDMRGRNVTRHP